MTKARITAILTLLAMLLSQTFYVSAEPTPTPVPTEIHTEEVIETKTFPEPRAKAALLFDLKGGRVIYENNASERNYPASVTKIMTALLALEKGNLTDVVTVSDNALADITYLHSKIGLKSGEQMTLENLLTGLLVASANDAANVIAEYISGDIQSFVALMNQKASELGMTNTHFANPHGFHDDNHYTTAADISIMAREALKNSKFCELVKIKTIKLPATNLSEERMLSSTNHLISRYRNTFHYYPYATGVKTGATDEAGNCLVSTAEKNGMSLMSIVLGCENADQKENAYSFVDSKAMFEYVFENYKSVTLATTSDIISDSKVYEAKDSTRVALSPSKDIIMLLPKDYLEENIIKDIKPAENISAPIEKGVNLGSATYTYKDANGISTFAVQVDLLAANEVKRDHLLHFLHGVGNILLSPFVLIPLILIAVFLVMNAINRSKRRRIRRKRMKSQRPIQRASYNTQQNRTTPSARRRTNYNTRSSRGGYSSTRSSSSQHSTRRPTSSTITRPRRPSSNPPRTPDPWDKYR
ncbi:MAG: D-alanyl-D-alanine carboxypeptidase family protein [Clostridia bacterium]|nr:D-alanyl-D-alanine carboxypeptidase family protein [Clostridia bacterium]